MTKCLTDFLPQIHGFHFGNEFINKVFDVGWASWHTKGLCGGMALSALDYFFAHKPIPTHIGADFPNGKTPPEGSALYKYIYDRLMDTFKTDGDRFCSWSILSDHHTLLLGDGVPKRTKTQELPKLFSSIQSGKPVAIGLIAATDLTQIGNNHQIVAYGYDLNEVTGDVIIYTYDNNHPETETRLNSNINDMYSHFSASWTQNGASYTQEWRGFFVENYTPKIPTYADLCISQSLSVSNIEPQIGDSFTAKFTVKNVGEYPAHLQSLSILMTGPSSENLENMLGKDNNNTDLPTYQEREIARTTDSFGTSTGKYTLYPVFYSTLGYKIDNLLTQSTLNLIGFTVTVLNPTFPAVVNSKWLSNAVLNSPPYVGKIQVVKALPNQTPVSFGQFDNSSICDCEKPTVLYSAGWENSALNNQRVLSIGSQPITPSRSIYVFIEFCRDNGYSTSMKDNTVKLKLSGTTPDNKPITIQITLSKVDDVSRGRFYWGSFNALNTWNMPYQLNMSIQGNDDLQHLMNRSQPGNVLDSNPKTVPVVNRNSPPTYPFTGYEPGADNNHKITIAPLAKSLNPDACEINARNDTIDKSTPIQLGLPVAPDNFQAPIATASLYNLNLDSAADVDWFSIQFQSSTSDDNSSLTAPKSSSFSNSMGLHVESVPPAIIIRCSNTGGNCQAISICLQDGTSVQSVAKGNTIVLYNPAKTFPTKKLFVSIKNYSYTAQGAFPYDLQVSYVPTHDVISGSISSNEANLDLRSVFLSEYFIAINLPRPGDDTFEKTIDYSLPVSKPAYLVKDIKATIKKTEAFLQDPANLAAIKSIVKGDPKIAIAADLNNLANLSMSTGLKPDAERLYKISADLYSKAGSVRQQTAVLKELSAMYVIQGKQTDANKILKKVG